MTEDEKDFYVYSILSGKTYLTVNDKRYISNLFDDNSLPIYENVNPNSNKVGKSFSIF